MTAKPTTFRVTLPTGAVETRKSKNAYTHAVVLVRSAEAHRADLTKSIERYRARAQYNAQASAKAVADAEAELATVTGPQAFVTRWSSRRELAESHAATIRSTWGPGNGWTVTVVAVD